jgi:hypothetical protein
MKVPQNYFFSMYAGTSGAKNLISLYHLTSNFYFACNLHSTFIFAVMEKAACFTVLAGLEGELKKSDSVQSIALFC